jgi:Mg/Co/Ni transporter MgtE
MSQRRRPLKIIETFDEQFSSLSSDELKTFVSHVRQRLDNIDEKEKPSQEEPKGNNIISRICLLSFLLILQSGSSFILQSFSELISRHILITMYLTMLVGAGGNAGNQAAVLVIRRLATSSSFSVQSLIIRETFSAIIIGSVVTLIGFIRVWIEERGAILPSLTIAIALFCIVTSSILLGTLLPIILQRIIRIDPAHAGPIIQVIMDILGVCITCAIGQTLLVNLSNSKHKEL